VQRLTHGYADAEEDRGEGDDEEPAESPAGAAPPGRPVLEGGVRHRP